MDPIELRYMINTAIESKTKRNSNVKCMECSVFGRV